MFAQEETTMAIITKGLNNLQILFILYDVGAILKKR
jgi:hypothetical protein